MLAHCVALDHVFNTAGQYLDLNTCWLDMCLVLELLGPDLRDWQLCFGNPGLPQSWVKQILTQVLNILSEI